MEPAFSDLKSAVTNKGNFSALLDSEKTPPLQNRDTKPLSFSWSVEGEEVGKY